MSKNTRNIIIVHINYLLLVGFLGLGGYLLMNYPENEALGGMVLGSTGVILGIIFPYHLKRTHVVEFQFIPSKWEIGKIILYVESSSGVGFIAGVDEMCFTISVKDRLQKSQRLL